MSDKTIKTKYFKFTPTWSGFDIKYHIAGYFESKPMLQIYFIWGKLFLYLPWKHYKKVERESTLKEKRNDKLSVITNPEYKPKKKYYKIPYNECDPPRYGVCIHMDSLCFALGDKTKIYDLPWALDWIRTSCLTKNNTWIHETKNNRGMNFWDIEKWKDTLFIENHPYRYITKSGEIQDCIATIKVREMEWRPKWFKWLKWTRKVHKDIEIDFSDDIGEKKGTWKGGCTGCSYQMLQGETPYETLKRMERERKF